MTPDLNRQRQEYYNSLPPENPRVFVRYSPPVAVSGGEVEVSLDIDSSHLPEGKSFQVILLSPKEERISATNINVSHLPAHLTIPDHTLPDYYILRVFDGDRLIDSKELEIIPNL
jgi:hypothetical protein